jgi:ribosomal protein L11 methylase PrmA
VTLGSAEQLETGAYDMIVANLTAGIHRDLAPTIADAARPDAIFVLSGLLHDQVKAALAAYGTVDLSEHTRDGQWSCVVFQRCQRRM